jgi:hypothetical protein
MSSREGRGRLASLASLASKFTAFLRGPTVSPVVETSTGALSSLVVLGARLASRVSRSVAVVVVGPPYAPRARRRNGAGGVVPEGDVPEPEPQPFAAGEEESPPGPQGGEERLLLPSLAGPAQSAFRSFSQRRGGPAPLGTAFRSGPAAASPASDALGRPSADGTAFQEAPADSGAGYSSSPVSALLSFQSAVTGAASAASALFQQAVVRSPAENATGGVETPRPLTEARGDSRPSPNAGGRPAGGTEFQPGAPASLPAYLTATAIEAPPPQPPTVSPVSPGVSDTAFKSVQIGNIQVPSKVSGGSPGKSATNMQSTTVDPSGAPGAEVRPMPNAGASPAPHVAAIGPPTDGAATSSTSDSSSGSRAPSPAAADLSAPPPASARPSGPALGPAPGSSLPASGPLIRPGPLVSGRPGQLDPTTPAVPAGSALPDAPLSQPIPPPAAAVPELGSTPSLQEAAAQPPLGQHGGVQASGAVAESIPPFSMDWRWSGAVAQMAAAQGLLSSYIGSPVSSQSSFSPRGVPRAPRGSSLVPPEAASPGGLAAAAPSQTVGRITAPESTGVEGRASQSSPGDASGTALQGGAPAVSPTGSSVVPRESLLSHKSLAPQEEVGALTPFGMVASLRSALAGSMSEALGTSAAAPPSALPASSGVAGTPSAKPPSKSPAPSAGGTPPPEAEVERELRPGLSAMTSNSPAFQGGGAESSEARPAPSATWAAAPPIPRVPGAAGWQPPSQTSSSAAASPDAPTPPTEAASPATGAGTPAGASVAAGSTGSAPFSQVRAPPLVSPSPRGPSASTPVGSASNLGPAASQNALGGAGPGATEGVRVGAHGLAATPPTQPRFLPPPAAPSSAPGSLGAALGRALTSPAAARAVASAAGLGLMRESLVAPHPHPVPRASSVETAVIPASPPDRQLATEGESALLARREAESVLEPVTVEEAGLSADDDRPPESRDGTGSREQAELLAMRKTIERILQEELRRYGIQ